MTIYLCFIVDDNDLVKGSEQNDTIYGRERYTWGFGHL